MGIENLLSRENLLDYGRMCNDVCELIKRYYEDADRIVIPSRGANPIIKGAEYSARVRSYHDDTYENVKKFIERNSLPVPLTADISIPEKYRKGGKNPERETNDTRRFGAYLIAEFFKDGKERRCSPYFSIYRYVLEEIEKRRNLAERYRKVEEIDSAILLDTVISGRALSTILENLYPNLPEGKELVTIAVADKHMKKLREPYKSKLYEHYYRGELHFVPVRRIITEDRGAGYLGISAIIYPDLKWKIEELAHISPVGCVTWYYPYELNGSKSVSRHRDFFDSLVRAVKESIKIDLEKRRVERLSEREKEKSKKKIAGLLSDLKRRQSELIDKSEEYKILSTPEPGLEEILRHIKPEMVYESSAHAVHVMLGDKTAERYARDFLRYYAKNCGNFKNTRR